MHSPTPRAVRVAAQVQRSLALLLSRGIKDPRVGNVTVTSVTVAPDLTVAQVRVLPFGSGHAAEETLAGLRSAAGYLRGAVGRDLNLRRAPRLEFAIDADLERAHHVSELIDRALRDDRAAAAAEASGPADQAGAAQRHGEGEGEGEGEDDRDAGA
jgi:ribosome-binding factor A